MSAGWISRQRQRPASYPDRTAGSSIYPALQNMLCRPRALGLGTTLTTRHTGYAKEVDAIFGLPPGVRSYAILPIRLIDGSVRPLGRAPLKDVVFQILPSRSGIIPIEILAALN